MEPNAEVLGTSCGQALVDDRFRAIHTKSTELIDLLFKLNNVSATKLDSLLGEQPPSDKDCEVMKSPDSWVENVEKNQDIAIGTVRHMLDRFELV